MTLVLDKRATRTPGTHAIIIGVSAYPHLDAKPPQLSDILEGLKSLASPADSARAFATWLAKTYSNPQAPIATIDLLLSDKAGQGFTLDGSEKGPVDTADISNIMDAALAWKARGDADPDGVMIFYFCGHGMSAGLRNALLACDVGRYPAMPSTNAFDPDLLLAGMKTCNAAKQVFFFDACRAANEELFKDFNQQMGGLVPAGGNANPAIAQAAFYSTRHGAPAYGPTDGGISVFTRILLKALDGLAANEAEGSWRINTYDIAKALDHASGPLYDPDFGDMQTPALGTGAGFDLHFLKKAPVAPFYLLPRWHEGDAPPIDAAGVSVRRSRAPAPSDWSAPWAEDPAGAWSWGPDRFKGEVIAGAMCDASILMTDGTVKELEPFYLSPPFRKFEVD
ncbi:caspase family protein [Sphingomonas sp. CFBP 8765]|uniref:caspase family protein n=1 Tax=Sphingomonas sp. CFBP 8765 TaxID=2775274 RepID=UPI0017815CCB|nr:caspase family protein [Sphingomonas sp. CFBP 8765]MBD8471554.1 caspase family protein [Sphingomonas sp. CFBP 8765]